MARMCEPRLWILIQGRIRNLGLSTTFFSPGVHPMKRHARWRSRAGERSRRSASGRRPGSAEIVVAGDELESRTGAQSERADASRVVGAGNSPIGFGRRGTGSGQPIAQQLAPVIAALDEDRSSRRHEGALAVLAHCDTPPARTPSTTPPASAIIDARSTRGWLSPEYITAVNRAPFSLSEPNDTSITGPLSTLWIVVHRAPAGGRRRRSVRRDG